MGLHYLSSSPLEEGYIPDRLWIVMPKEIGYFEEVCGIYKLNFNDHYYIGKSINIVMRQYAHACKLLYSLDPKYVKFYGKPKKIFDYLVSHPKLNYIHCEILKYCDITDLQRLEQLELDKSLHDPLCLNTKFTSGLANKEKIMIDKLNNRIKRKKYSYGKERLQS